MKIRECFVSNSSSSSFICKVPNLANVDDPVRIDWIDDRILDFKRWNDKDGLKEMEEIKQEYLEKCQSENVIMFDVSLSYYNDTDILGKLKRSIPGFDYYPKEF